MTTALLILAADDFHRPMPTIAGRPLAEHQARRAWAAGATSLLLIAPSMPDGLEAAVERLRDDGLPVRLAGDAGSAAGQVAPGETLLLVADGVLVEEAALAALAGAPSEALLVRPDGPGLAEWERLDAATRWAGAARLDGRTLVATVAMLGDWDLTLTLVRRLAPEAARIVATPADVARVRSAAEAGEAARKVLPGRLTGWVAEQPVEAEWLGWAALGAAAGGAALVGFGPLWLAAALLLAARPLAGLAAQVADARLEPRTTGAWPTVWPAALAAALLLLGWRLSGPGWEPLVLAGTTLAFLAALAGEARLTRLVPEPWSARPDWMLWAATPLALAGYGRWAVGGLAAWAAASFFRLQRRALAGRGRIVVDELAEPAAEAAVPPQRRSTGT